MSTLEHTLNTIDWSRPVGIHCIDDRGYKNADQNIKLGGASSYGLAYDMYAARALGREGKLDVEMPVGDLAKVITKGLARHALLASVHHECAAEANVLPIADEIIAHGEPILREVNRVMDGNVDESKFEQLQSFYAQLRTDAVLFRGVEAEAASMGSDADHPRIARSHLAHEDHVAQQLRINTQSDTWHDAPLAYANGQPLYQYDEWAIRPIAEKIDAFVPHDNVEGFALASVVRVVATSRLLPRDKKRSGVDIVLN